MIVNVAISEKLKNGGYRCITLKAFDCKGGDFVESEYTMVVADSNQQVLVELGADLPLSSGPQGFYKLIEIGVNNYDPQLFMKQQFTVYFFRKDNDSSDLSSTVSSSTMQLQSDKEIMQKRI